MLKWYGTSQAKVEGCALVHFGFRPEPSAMPLHDAANCGQADTGTFKFVVVMKSLKNTEECFGVIHIESNTVIAHEQHGFSVPNLLSHFDDRGGTRARELDCIRQQVTEKQFDESGIAGSPRQRPHAPLNVSAGSVGREFADDFPHELLQVNTSPGERMRA